jgi:hypothetical protein
VQHALNLPSREVTLRRQQPAIASMLDQASVCFHQPPLQTRQRPGVDFPRQLEFGLRADRRRPALPRRHHLRATIHFSRHRRHQLARRSKALTEPASPPFPGNANLPICASKKRRAPNDVTVNPTCATRKSSCTCRGGACLPAGRLVSARFSYHRNSPTPLRRRSSRTPLTCSS